jgi:hypothetical protein
LTENYFNFPKMLQSLIDVVARQKPSLSKEREAAKQKLLKDLKEIIGEEKPTSKEEEKTAEEQIRNLVEGQAGRQLFSFLSRLKKENK